MPLVELCPAPWTDPQVVQRAHALYAGAGQTPVTLSREIHGFLLNRVQAAVLDECFKLFEQGLASAEDIDKVLKDGLALRWSFMGPFETIDLNAPGGVTDYAKRYGAQVRQTMADGRPFDWSDDTLARLAWCILACSRAGDTWSVDAYLRTGRFEGDGTPVLAAPRRLVILQLVAMYFGAGMHVYF